MEAQITTAKITQSGNEQMNLPEKKMYYLQIATQSGTLRLNVGEKTFNTITGWQKETNISTEQTQQKNKK